MKKIILSVFGMIFLVPNLQANTCMNVTAEPRFFKEVTSLLVDRDTDKIDILKATIDLEYDESHVSKNFELSVSSQGRSSKACNVKQVGPVTNIRATLSVVRANGKEEGIQCKLDSDRFMQDREYALGTYNNPQLSFELKKIPQSRSSSVRQSLMVESCIYKITESSEPKQGKTLKKLSTRRSKN